MGIPYPRRKFGLTMAGVVGGTLLAGSLRTSAESKQPLRLGINPWAGVMPLVVADQKGLFAANGLELKLTLFPSISQMMDAFNAGKIDVTIIDVGTLLISATSGVSLKFVHLTDWSAGADAIVVSPMIKSLKDFKGQSISVEIGTIGHFLLLKALKAGGVSPDQVKLINQPADAALAAFVAGKTQIAVSYEPFITQATKQGKGKVIFSTKDLKIGPDIVAARQDYLDQHSGEIEKLIRVWYKVLDYRQKNLAASLPIEAKALGVSVPELQSLSQGVRLVTDPKEVVSFLDPKGGKESVVKLGQEFATFLTEQKLLTKQPPALETMIDNRPLLAYTSSL